MKQILFISFLSFFLVQSTMANNHKEKRQVYDNFVRVRDSSTTLDLKLRSLNYLIAKTENLLLNAEESSEKANLSFLAYLLLRTKVIYLAQWDKKEEKDESYREFREKVVTLLKDAAATGHVQACKDLFFFYVEGGRFDWPEIDHNNKHAFEFLTMAKGHRVGHFVGTYAAAVRRGIGTKQNIELAEKLDAFARERYTYLTIGFPNEFLQASLKVEGSPLSKVFGLMKDYYELKEPMAMIEWSKKNLKDNKTLIENIRTAFQEQELAGDIFNLYVWSLVSTHNFKDGEPYHWPVCHVDMYIKGLLREAIGSEKSIQTIAMMEYQTRVKEIIETKLNGVDHINNIDEKNYAQDFNWAGSEPDDREFLELLQEQ